MSTIIDSSILTSNLTTDANFVVTGDGIFDDLMEAINTHLQAQYNLNRITGPEYSTVYLGALQSAISEAMKFVLQKDVAGKNADVLAAQELLYNRQRQGFDDNKHQKVLETALSAWGVTYPDVATPSNPSDIATDAGLNALFTRAKQTNV